MGKATNEVDKYIFTGIAVIIIIAGTSTMLISGLTSINTTYETVFSNTSAVNVNTTQNGTYVIYATLNGTSDLTTTAISKGNHTVMIYQGILLVGNFTAIDGTHSYDLDGLTTISGANTITYGSTAVANSLNMTSSRLTYTLSLANTMSSLYAVLLALVPLGLLVGGIAIVMRRK